MSDSLPHSRFWASVEWFRAICPRCQGFILVLPTHNGPGRLRVSHGKWYDRLHQIVECPYCNRKYQVGLLFYPTGSSGGVRHVPEDVRLTKRELAELRALHGGGWFLREPAAKVRTETFGHKVVEIPAVNLYVPEPCTCPPLPWRASCAVHGAEVVGPMVESAPSDRKG